MKDSTILLLVILTVFIHGTLQLRAEVEIALEAELANEIVDPMIVTEDENASDGKFIWMEGAPVTGGGDEGTPTLSSTSRRQAITPSGCTSLHGMAIATPSG